jgi:ABC-type Fe3+/spermidine/putrescine transport system ATPase subunit
LGSAFDVAAPAGANGRAMALIAPEDVVIGGPTQGGLPATVRGRTFHGAITRVTLTANVDGEEVSLAADIPSRTAAALEDEAGVTLQVAPDHVRLFPV